MIQNSTRLCLCMFLTGHPLKLFILQLLYSSTWEYNWNHSIIMEGRMWIFLSAKDKCIPDHIAQWDSRKLIIQNIIFKGICIAHL